MLRLALDDGSVSVISAAADALAKLVGPTHLGPAQACATPSGAEAQPHALSADQGWPISRTCPRGRPESLAVDRILEGWRELSCARPLRAFVGRSIESFPAQGGVALPLLAAWPSFSKTSRTFFADAAILLFVC